MQSGMFSSVYSLIFSAVFLQALRVLFTQGERRALAKSKIQSIIVGAWLWFTVHQSWVVILTDLKYMADYHEYSEH
jgi:hypothetical protein